MLSSTFGIGIALAAIILFCWQGAIYLLAGLLAPFITDTLMTEISLVGGVLILSVSYTHLDVYKRQGRVLQVYIVMSIALLFLMFMFNAIFLLMATSLDVYKRQAPDTDRSRPQEAPVVSRVWHKREHPHALQGHNNSRQHCPLHLSLIHI